MKTEYHPENWKFFKREEIYMCFFALNVKEKICYKCIHASHMQAAYFLENTTNTENLLNSPEAIKITSGEFTEVFSQVVADFGIKSPFS